MNEKYFELLQLPNSEDHWAENITIELFRFVKKTINALIQFVYATIEITGVYKYLQDNTLMHLQIFVLYL